MLMINIIGTKKSFKNSNISFMKLLLRLLNYEGSCTLYSLLFFIPLNIWESFGGLSSTFFE